MSPAGSPEALQPVRDALLRRAREDADATRREAARAAAVLLSDARAEAERILLVARTTGAADAAVLTAVEQARVRRSARAVLLKTRCEIFEELRNRVTEALRAELAGPRGEEALTARIVEVLGPAATIKSVAAGGLTGVHGDLEVDCSLTQLAEHAMSTTAGLGQVWT